jgi:hypothetical protein
MSRRSFLAAAGIVVLLLASIGTGGALLLRCEPAHHRQSMVPPGPERIHASNSCLQNFLELLSAVRTQQSLWGQTFTDRQINSYLSEGFMKTGLAERLLPEGLSEPRVTFEPKRMRLSFRYRNRLINTVVSVTLRVWLPPSEPNVMAVCIEGFHAGAVPFKAQWLLERFSEAARQNEIDVSWYRHEGLPVALLRFQADQARPTLRLKVVHFDQGQVTIHGESTDRSRSGS